MNKTTKTILIIAAIIAAYFLFFKEKTKTTETQTQTQTQTATTGGSSGGTGTSNGNNDSGGNNGGTTRKTFQKVSRGSVTHTTAQSRTTTGFAPRTLTLNDR